MKLSFTFAQQTSFAQSGFIVSTFKYMDKSYQEIVNEQDFEFESLWSAVGGFIGIFVGASLSQVPAMMADAWKLIQYLKRTN